MHTVVRAGIVFIQDGRGHFRHDRNRRVPAKTDATAVTISVEDNGIGFNKQTEQSLFKKFIPGHLGTNGEPSTGLGLYLAKNIVEKHDGSITAFSEGKGARFSVAMPIKTE